MIVPLTVAVVIAHAGQAGAQGSFPAPLPGQVRANDPAFPPVPGRARASDPAFPPVNGSAPVAEIGAPPSSGSFPVNGAAPIEGPGAGFSRAPAAPPQSAAGSATPTGPALLG